MSVYTQTATAEKSAGTLDRVLLIARIALGIPLIYHGAAIAFGAFGGPGLQGFVHASGGKLPLPVAALVGYGEFLGGLGVLFGVLARPAAAGLLLIMLGAIGIVHLKNGYDGQKGGFEYPLTLVFLEIIILVAGPGLLNAWTLVRPKKNAV